MSLFDGIQKKVTTDIQRVFGDAAVWIPSNKIPVTGLVLFKNPNDPIVLGEEKITYRPYNYSIEYYEGQFIGLKESVDSGVIEAVSVKGFNLNIREVMAKFDGKTYIAYGEI